MLMTKQRVATMRGWLMPSLMVGLVATGVLFAFWSSSQWSNMGLIRFRTGEELFCYALTTDTVGVSCQGPAFRNSGPALPRDFNSRHTWPWTLVDHIERERSHSLLSHSDPVWLRSLVYTAGALVTTTSVIVFLFMLRALVRFLRS